MKTVPFTIALQLPMDKPRGEKASTVTTVTNTKGKRGTPEGRKTAHTPESV